MPGCVGRVNTFGIRAGDARLIAIPCATADRRLSRHNSGLGYRRRHVDRETGTRPGETARSQLQLSISTQLRSARRGAGILPEDGGINRLDWRVAAELLGCLDTTMHECIQSSQQCMN